MLSSIRLRIWEWNDDGPVESGDLPDGFEEWMDEGMARLHELGKRTEVHIYKYA